jgi:hypothetical protein
MNILGDGNGREGARMGKLWRPVQSSWSEGRRVGETQTRDLYCSGGEFGEDFVILSL